MKKLWYTCICVILFLILIFQIYGIINIEVENINEHQFNYGNREIVEAESPTMPPVSLYDVMEAIYKENPKCKVISFSFGEDKRLIEAELSMTGAIEDIEVMLNNLQNSRGFKEIKKYIEGEGYAKRVFVTFEISS